jgi:ElaB/YqjD/DUF883 family membrane-anchored ribosome-binding protein
MNERELRTMGEGTGRRLAESAQDMAYRTGSYVQSQASRASERAQELASRASERAQELAEEARDRMARIGDTSFGALTNDVRRFVADHPLQALAITVGLGFLLGKLLQRDR